MKEIKASIDALTPQERSELERLLSEPVPSAPVPLKLPDQAARRHRIFGDKVLPNLVIEARESEAA